MRKFVIILFVVNVLFGISEIAKSNEKKKYRMVEMYVKTTAYCPCKKCCGVHANGITSTGKNAWKRGIAVDPRIIPYGAKIEVKGYGTHFADDTGGAIKTKRGEKTIKLDLRFKTHREALNWGVQYMKVYVWIEE